MVYVFIFIVIIIVGIIISQRKRRQSKLVKDLRTLDEVQQFQPDHKRKEELMPTSVGTSPFSILIVDDQSTIRLLMRELFEIERLTVYEASNGRRAIEHVQVNQIDAILLDLKMPDMDGIEALRQIRKIAPDILVVMITGYGDPDIIEEAKKMGVQSFFTKPFDISLIKDYVMSRLLEKDERERLIL